jgi:hypothetical protein
MEQPRAVPRLPGSCITLRPISGACVSGPAQFDLDLLHLPHCHLRQPPLLFASLHCPIARTIYTFIHRVCLASVALSRTNLCNLSTSTSLLLLREASTNLGIPTSLPPALRASLRVLQRNHRAALANLRENQTSLLQLSTQYNKRLLQGANMRQCHLGRFIAGN